MKFKIFTAVATLFSFLTLISCVKEKYPDTLVGKWKYGNSSSGYTSKLTVSEETSGGGNQVTFYVKSPTDILFNGSGIVIYDSATGKGNILFPDSPEAVATITAVSERKIQIVLKQSGTCVISGTFTGTLV